MKLDELSVSGEIIKTIIPRNKQGSLVDLCNGQRNGSKRIGCDRLVSQIKKKVRQLNFFQENNDNNGL